MASCTLAEIAQQVETAAVQLRVLSQLPEGQRGGEIEKAIQTLNDSVDSLAEQLQKAQSDIQLPRDTGKKRMDSMKEQLQKSQSDIQAIEDTRKHLWNSLNAGTHNHIASTENAKVLSNFTELTSLHDWQTNVPIPGLPKFILDAHKLDDSQVNKMLTALGWNHACDRSLRQKQRLLLHQMGCQSPDC